MTKFREFPETKGNATVTRLSQAKQRYKGVLLQPASTYYGPPISSHPLTVSFHSTTMSTGMPEDEKPRVNADADGNEEGGADVKPQLKEKITIIIKSHDGRGMWFLNNLALCPSLTGDDSEIKVQMKKHQELKKLMEASAVSLSISSLAALRRARSVRDVNVGKIWAFGRL